MEIGKKIIIIIISLIIAVVVLFTILNIVEINSRSYKNSNQLEQNSISHKQNLDQFEQNSHMQNLDQLEHLEKLARIYALNQRYVTIKSCH